MLLAKDAMIRPGSGSLAFAGIQGFSSRVPVQRTREEFGRLCDSLLIPCCFRLYLSTAPIYICYRKFDRTERAPRTRPYAVSHNEGERYPLFLVAYDRAMDRTEWVSRFMRRMAQLDVRLRPGQIAEMASVMFEKYQASSPEGAADEAGKDGVRRDD